MLAMTLRRLLMLPVIVLVVYTITFVLAWLIPGNPLDNPEGRQASPEVVEAMKKQYDLDDPVTFYFSYLGDATGISWLLGDSSRPFDLGPSLKQADLTVNEILAAGLPVSLELGFTAILLATVIGLGAGLVSGLKPRSLLDFSTQSIALVGISLPSFVTGAVLLIVFAVWLKWFPVAQWGRPVDLVLPAVTLSLPFAAYISRLVRFGMNEQMTTDHARTARAKGLSEAGVAMRHALKNAFLPVLSYLGPAAAIALTGSFVVEKIFSVPGIGRHFVDGVLSKDLTLIMGVVLVYSSVLVLFNLIVDVLYAWVDPRIANR
ncbi:MAG: ABC transporter permease [Planctomycetota bacterium]|nr:ABC transporter permease [Planctomycetota bacterium]MEC8559309.1 ABC transporter permease [Planctomycetota bacterium]MEC8734004.1 ABC transporter permease [Planctomycetota bacterium]MEC9156917.1 ABC transporter permease [Planctomycetota bacterium]MED5507063.1 ABC transporter permease [Planctomycetota bacterium]